LFDLLFNKKKKIATTKKIYVAAFFEQDNIFKLPKISKKTGV
jgi:hypothetical protein